MVSKIWGFLKLSLFSPVKVCVAIRINCSQPIVLGFSLYLLLHHDDSLLDSQNLDFTGHFMSANLKWQFYCLSHFFILADLKKKIRPVIFHIEAQIRVKLLPIWPYKHNINLLISMTKNDKRYLKYKPVNFTNNINTKNLRRNHHRWRMPGECLKVVFMPFASWEMRKGCLFTYCRYHDE